MAGEKASIESMGENFGYAFSVEDAYEFIRELETKSTTKFIVCRAHKDFGAIGEICPLLFDNFNGVVDLLQLVVVVLLLLDTSFVDRTIITELLLL